MLKITKAVLVCGFCSFSWGLFYIVGGEKSCSEKFTNALAAGHTAIALDLLEENPALSVDVPVMFRNRWRTPRALVRSRLSGCLDSRSRAEFEKIKTILNKKPDERRSSCYCNICMPID